MKRVLTTAAASILFCFGTAHAHTRLQSSMPVDKEVLASAPKEIMLHFSEATRLTSLSIQKEGEKEQKSVGALPRTAAKDVTVTLEPLSPGKYDVNWRAVGRDNHVMSGKLQFTVAQ